MRMVMLGIALAVILAVILAAARAVLPGASGKALIAPTIRFDGRERAAGGASNMLRLSVVNPNRTPVYVYGYLLHPDADKHSKGIKPLYRVEVRRAGKWIPVPIGWCGTGSGLVPLAPGAKRFFSIEEPEGKWDSVRAGFSWSAAPSAPSAPVDLAKTEVVWSVPVTSHELAGSSDSGKQAE